MKNESGVQRGRDAPEKASAAAPVSLAVVNCGELVTLAGAARARVGHELRELAIRKDAVLLVTDGRIAGIGGYKELKAQILPGTEVIDAGGRAVMPGFVDAHTHLVFGGNRVAEFEQRVDGASYQEIAAAGGGIVSTLRQTRTATEAELMEAALGRAEWFLRGGTTTIEAKSGYGQTVESEVKILRVIAGLKERTPLGMVPTVLAAHVVPPEYKEDRAGYVRLVTEEMLPVVAEQRLAGYCDVFCDEHAFTVDEARVILAAAKRLGFGLRMHVEQFAADGSARLAAEMGATTADHLEYTDEAGIGALRAAGVQPVLVPGSVFALGRSKYPDARAMIAGGLAPVLATDFNPGSSPMVSMAFVISLAALSMKMLPAEAVMAATMNAAASLGLEGEIGSLEEGKRADFAIHEFEDYREIAYYVAAPVRPQVYVAGRRVA
jgi:imidazolonepropionase